MAWPAPVPAVPGYALRAPVAGCSRPGEGQWQAVRLGDQQQVRLVTVPVPEERSQALARVAEVAAVRHRSLVPVHDAVPCDAGLAVVLGWQARARMSRVLARRVRLTEAEVAGLLADLGELLARLHQDGMVHGGLSAEEVWLTESGRAVVADLAVQAVRPRPGPMPAPELTEGFACSPDSDVWDLAVLARTCLDGRPPRLGEDRPEEADTAGSGTGSELRDLLAECLVADPARRPAAEEVAERAPEAVRRTTTVWHGAPPERTDDDEAEGDGDRRTGPSRRLVTLSALTATLLLTGAVLHGWDTSGSAQQHRDAEPDTVAATAPATVAEPAADAGPARPRTPPTAASAEEPPSSAEAAPTAAVTGPTSQQQPAAPDRAPAGSPAVTGTPGSSASAQLLQRLLDARAEAWREPGTGALERALARGSPAMAHDRAALEEAAGLGVTYPGLAFTVAGAEVVRDRPGRRVVTAQVRRAAYRITGGPAGAGGITEPAQAHDVRVVLTSGPRGWRIHDWRPTGDDS